MKRKTIWAALALPGLLALSACAEDGTADDATTAEAENEVQSETIAALIADAGNLSNVESLLSDAGMAGVFDGNAAYTILAPTDEAFDALGEDFQGDEARPAMIAVLREHILPGHMALADIRSAIETEGGPVEMETMGDGTLTFSMEGDTISVASTDGGDPVPLTTQMQGANGVVLPVNAVLKEMQPAA